MFGGLLKIGVSCEFPCGKEGVDFNFDFPVGGGHVNIVDYSNNGTASILFAFPKCCWLLGGEGLLPQGPLQSILSIVTIF